MSHERVIKNDECEEMYFEEVVVNDLDQFDEEVDNVDHLKVSSQKDLESSNSSLYIEDITEIPKCVILNQELTNKRRGIQLKRPGNLSKHHVKKRKYLKLPTSQEQVVEECELFGKILAKKLCRLPEKCKDLIMFKINQLVYKTCLEYKSKAQ